MCSHGLDSRGLACLPLDLEVPEVGTEPDLQGGLCDLRWDDRVRGGGPKEFTVVRTQNSLFWSRRLFT